MGQRIKIQELRDLLNLAKRLRDSADATADDSYIDLFLRTASALEDRAAYLAFGRENPAAASLHRSAGFLC
jgi:hypothetical protein